MNKACISCGELVIDGGLLCPNYKNTRIIQPDAILQDGTLVYLKTRTDLTNVSLQLYLYDLLNRRSK